MARFSRIQVALTMKETGMVPVFYHKDVEVCKQVVKACYEGEFVCSNSQTVVILLRLFLRNLTSGQFRNALK